MNRSDGITEHNQWRLIFQVFNMRNAITCTKIKLKKERKINCLPIFDHPVIQQISKKKKKKSKWKEKGKDNTWTDQQITKAEKKESKSSIPFSLSYSMLYKSKYATNQSNSYIYIYI